MGAIFISYRRDDSEGQAGRLFDELARHFGKEAMFMDVATIEPGRDFRRVIDEQVASCGVLLAVIGKHWVSAENESGGRRLDDPLDFVRLETASALKRDIPVVPVLVHGAKMPRTEQLPDDLKELAFRNGVELTHARWDSDVQVLVNALRPYVLSKEEQAPASIASSQLTSPRSAPPRSPPQVAAPPTKLTEAKSTLSRNLWLGVGLAVAVAMFAVVALRGGSSTRPADASVETAVAAAKPELSSPVAPPPNFERTTPYVEFLRISEGVAGSSSPTEEDMRALARAAWVACDDADSSCRKARELALVSAMASVCRRRLGPAAAPPPGEPLEGPGTGDKALDWFQCMSKMNYSMTLEWGSIVKASIDKESERQRK